MSVHNEPPEQNFLKMVVALHLFGMLAFGSVLQSTAALYRPDAPWPLRLMMFSIGCGWGHFVFGWAWKAALRSRGGDDDDE